MNIFISPTRPILSHRPCSVCIPREGAKNELITYTIQPGSDRARLCCPPTNPGDSVEREWKVDTISFQRHVNIDQTEAHIGV